MDSIHFYHLVRLLLQTPHTSVVPHGAICSQEFKQDPRTDAPSIGFPVTSIKHRRGQAGESAAGFPRQDELP